MPSPKLWGNYGINPESLIPPPQKKNEPEMGPTDITGRGFKNKGAKIIKIEKM